MLLVTSSRRAGYESTAAYSNEVNCNFSHNLALPPSSLSFLSSPFLSFLSPCLSPQPSTINNHKFLVRMNNCSYMYTTTAVLQGTSIIIPQTAIQILYKYQLHGLKCPTFTTSYQFEVFEFFSHQFIHLQPYLCFQLNSTRICIVVEHAYIIALGSYLCSSTVASFPGLPRLQFLIACSKQKWSQKFLHTASDQKLELGKAWERG